MPQRGHNKTCPLCKTRKAKRQCPALAEAICSICCATKRNRQIQCPGHCRYLRQGLAYTSVRMEEMEARENEKALPGFLEQYADALQSIINAIMDVKRKLYPDLAREEVREAINLLIRTHETLERGIIYQFYSKSFKVQSVINAIQNSLNALKSHTNRRIDVRETIRCLRYILNTTVDTEEAWEELLNIHKTTPC